MEDHV